ncbi:hypothetical protein PRIPAC_82278, partial [Pristionchus pacificus]
SRGMSVDPITGLPNGDDSSQETQSIIPQRPQSPLVRGSHLDRSTDRAKKQSYFVNQLDNDHVQFPVKRGELQGFIPPAYGVVHMRERLDHIVDVVQSVIDGKEELVSEQELLSTHPLNLEKTRFTMSKKKLKLQFMDVILDRFDDDRSLHPQQFERRRKLWHKSVARSLKLINKFLEKELLSCENVRQSDCNENPGNATVGSSAIQESISKTGRGRPKTKAILDNSTAPKKRGRKAKENTNEDGLASISKLTLPAPTRKIPKKSTTNDDKASANSSGNAESKKPRFGRKRKDVEMTVSETSEQIIDDNQTKKKTKKKQTDNEDCEATMPKKSRKDNASRDGSDTKKAPSNAKKPAFGAPKRGKKGSSGEKAVGVLKQTETSDETNTEKPVSSGDLVDEVKGAERMKSQSDNVNDKRLEVYEKMDEDVESVTMSSQKTSSQYVPIPLIPPSIRDEGMETDDEDWEPNETPKEITPPRSTFHSSQDNSLLPTSSSYISQSSQSLFGSVSSSLMGSPNTSFSSQTSSSLLAPPLMTSSFNLSSVLIPSQQLATSTQIPTTRSLRKQDEGEEKEKKPILSGPRVRPTFGKKK